VSTIPNGKAELGKYTKGAGHLLKKPCSFGLFGRRSWDVIQSFGLASLDFSVFEADEPVGVFVVTIVQIQYCMICSKPMMRSKGKEVNVRVGKFDPACTYAPMPLPPICRNEAERNQPTL
jgi:hypothetical protein